MRGPLSVFSKGPFPGAQVKDMERGRFLYSSLSALQRPEKGKRTMDFISIQSTYRFAEWTNADKTHRMIQSKEEEVDAPKTVCVYMTLARALTALKNHWLHVSRISSMNDPLECSFGITMDIPDKETRKEDLKQQYNDRFGFLCFSERKDSHCLWGQYGDRHRGVVLGFSMDNLQKVEYGQNRVCFQKSVTEETASRIVQSSVFVKPADWEHEKEWRRFVLKEETVEHDNEWYFPIHPVQLKEVICGLVVSPYDVHRVNVILSNCGYVGIQTQKMTVSETDYMLHPI